MKGTNILTLAITLTLGVILAGSLMMPVISDAQTNIGDKVTLDNSAYPTSNYLYSIWDGSDITLTYDTSGDTPAYYIDGEQLTLQSIEQRIIIASNDFAARTGGSSIPLLNTQYIESTTPLNNTPFTLSVVDKEYTLTLGNSTYTGSMEWLVYASIDGNAGLIQSKNTTTPFYTSANDKIIVLGNIYTTGDNDTFYSYFNGQLSVNEAYADESSVTITSTIASGYTDIYNTTIQVNVGDESFYPFFVLIPEKVSGHEASGAAYNLLGALPVMVIIGLVLAATAAIVVKRND